MLQNLPPPSISQVFIFSFLYHHENCSTISKIVCIVVLVYNIYSKLLSMDRDHLQKVSGNLYKLKGIVVTGTGDPKYNGEIVIQPRVHHQKTPIHPPH